MTNLDAFRIEIRTRGGTVISKDLPHDASGTSFTRTLSVAGQQAVDGFTLALLQDWGNSSNFRLIYDQLGYWQEVWIFNRFLDDLLFVGYILEITATESNKSITGQCVMHYLTRQDLGQYQIIGDKVGDNLTTVLGYLTKPWLPVSLSDFQDLQGWTQDPPAPPTLGTWEASGGLLVCTSDGYIFNSWNITSMPYRWKIKVKGAALLENRTTRLSVRINKATNQEFSLDIIHTAGETGHLFILTHSGSVTKQRYETVYIAPVDNFMIVDLWVYSDRLEFWLNGIQRIVIDPATGISTSGYVQFWITAETGQKFDNAIRFSKPEYIGLSLDTIHSGSNAEQQFGQNSFYQAIIYYLDRFDLESRVNFSKDGNHALEIGDLLGDDVSNYVIFSKDKGNISKISSPTSSKELATVVSFFGTGQETNQILGEALDIEAINRYGYLKSQLNDGNITINSIADDIAQSELNKTKGGIESLMLTIVDAETTRGRWQVGDFVWVQHDRIGIDRAARVIRARYQDASPSIDITCDNQPASMAAELSKHKGDIDKIYRGNKGSTGKSIYSIERKNQWIGNNSVEFKYTDSPSASIPNDSYWNYNAGSPAIGSFQGDLHFVNLNDAFVIAKFYGSGIEIYARKDGNIGSMEIWIDDLATSVGTVDLNSGSRVDRFLVYEDHGLVSGPHILKIARSGAADLNLYVNLDSIRLDGWYKSFVVEGKAVNFAEIAWIVNDDDDPVPGSRAFIKIKIDDIDRTEALLLSAGGAQGNQTVNALQFLSKPGFHSVELIQDNPLLDIYLEATITVTVLVE